MQQPELLPSYRRETEPTCCCCCCSDSHSTSRSHKHSGGKNRGGPGPCRGVRIRTEPVLTGNKTTAPALLLALFHLWSLKPQRTQTESVWKVSAAGELTDVVLFIIHEDQWRFMFDPQRVGQHRYWYWCGLMSSVSSLTWDRFNIRTSNRKHYLNAFNGTRGFWLKVQEGGRLFN